MRAFAFLFLIATVAFPCQVDSIALKPWNQRFDFSEMEHFLLTAAPRRVMRMGDYLRSIGREPVGEGKNTFYVEFTDDIAGVFKSEEELWDSYGEVATYEHSKDLGVHYVPPTVIRDLRWPALWSGKRNGSLQYFVRTSKDMSKLSMADVKALLSPEVWGQIIALLYPLGQWDFYAENIVLDDTNTPALIDNACIMDVSFHRYGDYPYIRRGRLQPDESLADHIHGFPYHTALSLIDPSFARMKQTLLPFAGPAAIQRWHEDLIPLMPQRTLRYVVWNNVFYMYRNPTSLGFLKADHYDPQLLSRLHELTQPTALERRFSFPFTRLHRALIRDRAQQFIHH